MDGTGEDASQRRLPLRLLLVLALLTTVAPFSIDMYLPGLPQLAADLGTDATRVQLTLTAFMLGLAGGQLVIGPLSDRFGRRRPLVIGAVVCAASAVVCALAPSIEVLVTARCVQGFSGAAGLVIARAVVADLRSGRAAAQAFSLLMTINGLAPVVAPVLGGIVIALSGWRAVFLALTAIAVVMAAGAILVVPETLPAGARHGGGLQELCRAIRQVLRARTFVAYALVLAFSFGALFAYISASSFVLQNVVGLSVGMFSVAFAANAVGIMVTSAGNARLVGRVAPARLLAVAVGVQVCAAVALAVLFGLGVTAAAAVLPVLFVSAAVLGGVFGNATALALEQVRRAAGTGSAVIGVTQYGMGALVTPLVGLGGDRAALPMAMTMTACSLLAAVVLLALRLGAQRAARRAGNAPAVSGSPRPRR